MDVFLNFYGIFYEFMKYEVKHFIFYNEKQTFVLAARSTGHELMNSLIYYIFIPSWDLAKPSLGQRWDEARIPRKTFMFSFFLLLFIFIQHIFVTASLYQ